MALKEPASPREKTEIKDPICGMTVSVAGAKYTSDFDGRSFFFRCRRRKQAFDEQPEKYAPAIVGLFKASAGLFAMKADSSA
jgi:YHS domain-containing protein